MPIINKYKKNGFSFVELLVVVGIITILSSIGMTVYIQAEIKSRDNQRLADLKQVQAALEQYRNDTGYYPISLDFDGGGQVSTTIINPITQISSTNIYLSILPKDPQYSSNSAHKNYSYRSRPNTAFGEASNCDNTPKNNCLNYCLFVQAEVTPSSSGSDCLTSQFTDMGYNFSLKKGNK